MGGEMSDALNAACLPTLQGLNSPPSPQVLERQIPLVGVFLNGEIGPAIKAGYVGWISSEASSTFSIYPTYSSLDDGLDGQGDEEVLLRMRMLGEPSLCESQGWTTTYSMLSA